MFKVLVLAVVFLAMVVADDPFLVKFTVNLGQKKKGEIVMEVHPDWAPLGAERMRELVQASFFDSARFFRVLPGFMVQWGLPGKPEVYDVWAKKIMPDEPVLQSNTRGMVSYAAAGRNSRTSQMFINYGDNSDLDSKGFTPFARVIKGMDVAESIYFLYGEKPDQGAIRSIGNKYLKKAYPKLSYIESVEFLEERPEGLDAEMADAETAAPEL